MQLIINGKETTCAEGITVSQLLQSENVKMPDMVSVELNSRILRRPEYDRTILQPNDQIEFLYFMGGGHAVDGCPD